MLTQLNIQAAVTTIFPSLATLKLIAGDQHTTTSIQFTCTIMNATLADGVSVYVLFLFVCTILIQTWISCVFSQAMKAQPKYYPTPLMPYNCLKNILVTHDWWHFPFFDGIPIGFIWKRKIIKEAEATTYSRKEAIMRSVWNWKPCFQRMLKGILGSHVIPINVWQMRWQR